MASLPAGRQGAVMQAKGSRGLVVDFRALGDIVCATLCALFKRTVPLCKCEIFPEPWPRGYPKVCKAALELVHCHWVGLVGEGREVVLGATVGEEGGAGARRLVPLLLPGAGEQSWGRGPRT